MFRNLLQQREKEKRGETAEGRENRDKARGSGPEARRMEDIERAIAPTSGES